MEKDKNKDFNLPVFPDVLLNDEEKLKKAIQILEKSIDESLTYDETEIREIWSRQEKKLVKVLKPFVDYVRREILSSKKQKSMNYLFEKIKKRLREKLRKTEDDLLKNYKENIERKEL